MGEMTPEQRAAYMAKHPHLFAQPAPAAAAKDWTPYTLDDDVEAELDRLEEAVYKAHKERGKAAALGLAVRLKAQASGGRVNLPAGELDDAAERFMAAVAAARAAKPDAELGALLDDLTRQLQAWVGQAPGSRELQLVDGEKPQAAAKSAPATFFDKMLASVRSANRPSPLVEIGRKLGGGK